MSVSTTRSENSTHSMRYAPYQVSNLNRAPQGNPGLLHIHTQLYWSSWRIIHVTDMNLYLVPGVFIMLDQDKVVLEDSLCPERETLLQHRSVHLMVHGVGHHRQLTIATIMKSRPYDRWTDITICFLHTDINVPLTLPPTHPSSSICMMQIESWLVS